MKQVVFAGVVVFFVLVSFVQAVVMVDSDSFYYGLDTTTDSSSVTGSNAFEADFDEGSWYIGTDGSGTSQRWYVRQTSNVLISVAQMNTWELTFTLTPGREITSVSIDVMTWQIGSSVVGSNFKMGFGYVNALGEYVILKELLGVSNSSKSANYNGHSLPQDTAGMTALTLFGYVQARNSDAANVAGQIFQFGRGNSTSGDDFQITVNTQIIEEKAAADLNQDSVVNIIDLAMFSSQWLDTIVIDPNAAPDPNALPTPDFNGDTYVNFNDFAVINREWSNP